VSKEKKKLSESEQAEAAKKIVRALWGTDAIRAVGQPAKTMEQRFEEDLRDLGFAVGPESKVLAKAVSACGVVSGAIVAELESLDAAFKAGEQMLERAGKTKLPPNAPDV